MGSHRWAPERKASLRATPAAAVGAGAVAAPGGEGASTSAGVVAPPAALHAQQGYPGRVGQRGYPAGGGDENSLMSLLGSPKAVEVGPAVVQK